MSEADTRLRALVTGATSGIGRAFARRLASDGYDVVVHGRRAERLRELAGELRTRHGVAADVLVADLADPDGVLRVEEEIRSRPLQMLVNNAGFTPLEPFLDHSADDHEAMIRVHVLAVTRLAHAALPAMLQDNRGAIINVSSDGVFVPFPRDVMTVYAATKAYVNTFTRGLQTLVQGTEVRVQALCPGFVESEILERHGITFADWGIPDEAVMTAEDQVNVSLAALDLGEVICVPTLDDATLLQRVDELNDTVRQRSSGTGVPARRYRGSG
jgi:short-subunit dehydrogenase